MLSYRCVQSRLSGNNNVTPTTTTETVTMRYLQPSLSEEMNLLEEEVYREMTDAESSFITQRKVYQFLVNDLERHNISLTNELKEYRDDMKSRLDELKTEIADLRSQLDSEDSENRDLHELVFFFGNQLNRRKSKLVSSSTILESSESSSTFLDNILDELQCSTSKCDTSEVRIHDAINTIRQSISSKLDTPSPKDTNTTSCDEIVEVIETLTENIILKDQLIERLENDNEEQAEYIRLLSEQHLTDLKNSSAPSPQKSSQDSNFTNANTNLIITQLLSIIQNITESQPVNMFGSKTVENAHGTLNLPVNVEMETSTSDEIQKDANVVSKDIPPVFTDIQEQLKQIRKEEHHRFTSGDASKKTAHDPRSETNVFSSSIPRRIMNKYGYQGGGLGKYENGITSPIRAKRQIRFTGSSPPPTAESSNISQQPNQNEKKPWPKGTTLIIGDSMISGVNERGLSNFNAKVSCQPGAIVSDMYDYIKPLLKKKPSNVIFHVSTNDAPYKPSHEIVKELLELRIFIENELPGCKTYISCPTFRTDNQLANSTISIVRNRLKSVDRVLLNENIDGICIGKRGLHLNKEGSRRLARNFIS